MDCVFCKIVSGEIPSTKVYENDALIAFKDNNPQAKVHILIVPKAHVKDADAINESNIELVKQVFLVAPQIAQGAGLKDGYRIITNVGEHGQQSVPHIHFHLVGGEQLKWELA